MVAVIICVFVFIWKAISGMRKELEARENGEALTQEGDFSVIAKIFFSYLQFVPLIF